MCADRELQPTTSGASFGSFTDAPEAFAYPGPVQPHSPSHHQAAHANNAAAAFAGQALQPHSDLPWGHSNGAAHMPYSNKSAGEATRSMISSV